MDSRHKKKTLFGQKAHLDFFLISRDTTLLALAIPFHHPVVLVTFRGNHHITLIINFLVTKNLQGQLNILHAAVIPFKTINVA